VGKQAHVDQVAFCMAIHATGIPFEHLPAVERVVNQAGTGLVWSPNFSVGVAVFRKLTALAADLMRDHNRDGEGIDSLERGTYNPSGRLESLAVLQRGL